MTLCTALSPHNMVHCDVSEHQTTHDIHTRVLTVFTAEMSSPLAARSVARRWLT